MRMTEKPATLLTAGVFCAFAATLISSTLIVCFWAVPAHAVDHWYHIPHGILMMCLYTFIPAGGVGFLCGVLGSLYLVLRARRITSRLQLLVESAVIGALLSALFPLFHLVMRWGPTGDWLDRKAILFCVAVGCPVSIFYAAIFRMPLLGDISTRSGVLGGSDRQNPS